jgi:hypothetical protein
MDGNWGGIIPSQACGGFNPPQSPPFLLASGITEDALIPRDFHSRCEDAKISHRKFPWSPHAIIPNPESVTTLVKPSICIIIFPDPY